MRPTATTPTTTTTITVTVTMDESPPSVATFHDLLERRDELWHVLECVSPTEAQYLARVSRRSLGVVVAYVRDHGGLRRLWRCAWPETLVVHRNPSRRDWSRTVVHASWALSEQAQRSFTTNEQVCINIDPPASVGEFGLVMAWCVTIEWRASVGRGSVCRYAVAHAVVDARDGRLGVSHAQRVPCAHRLASDSVAPTRDVPVSGLMRAMGWLSSVHVDAVRRLRIMAETRSDGSIFFKAMTPVVGTSTSTSTNLPTVRILPSSDLRAVFWLYSRALGPSASASHTR